jgi:hypothetical protein
MPRSRLLPLAALALAASCGGESPDARPAVPDAGNPSARRAAAAAESLAVATDQWNRAEVVKRLTEAGMVVADSGDTVRHDFLSVPGSRMRVGGYELQLFIYPDTLARARDLAGLDTARVAPRGGSVDWPDRPWLVSSGNLLAIFLTPRSALTERVTLALEARHLGIGR